MQSEGLARFIFDKDHYTRAGKVKAAAFLPAPDGMTSVFRVSRMDPSYYEDVKRRVADARDRKIKSTGLVASSSVLEQGLDLVPEESDYKWHADICGWPDSKDDRKAIAQEIALKARVE